MDDKTSDEKLWAGFAYLGLICCMIPTVVIFFLKREESDYIKFHSLQGMGLWVASFVLSIVFMALTNIPVLGMVFGIVHLLLSLVICGYWVYLMIQAFQGNDIEIPYLAPWIQENLMT
jgi:uncharacterized membrane protein